MSEDGTIDPELAKARTKSENKSVTAARLQVNALMELEETLYVPCHYQSTRPSAAENKHYIKQLSCKGCPSGKYAAYSLTLSDKPLMLRGGARCWC